MVEFHFHNNGIQGGADINNRIYNIVEYFPYVRIYVMI
jgi:hypothetical protein